VLGFSALGTAALGTDGSSLAAIIAVGASATGVAGALSGNNASIAIGSANAAAAVGSVALAQSISSGGVCSSGIAAAVVAQSSYVMLSVSATVSIGNTSTVADGVAPGAATVGAAGALASSFTLATNGVAGSCSVGPLMPGISVAVGTFPITSDGVLGLWTLGDATLGIDVPPESWFSGVAGSGACAPSPLIVNNSVAAIAAVGLVVPDTTSNAAGQAAIGQVSQLASTLTFESPGVAATGLFAPATAYFPVPLEQVSAIGYTSVLNDGIAWPALGVYSVGVAGSGRFDDPSSIIVGCAGITMPGTIFSLSPSSAFGLWGAPVPGGTVTVAFGGLPSIAATVGTGQSTAQVASALAALINANASLTTAGISARAADNVVELHQPPPAKIPSSVTFSGT
jgi:hypothetical protein